MNRMKAREAAFSLIFSIDLQGADIFERLEEYKAQLEPEDQNHMPFIEGLVKGVFENLQELDQVIAENLRENWSLERISKVSRAALRTAIYELQKKDVPNNAIISEALQLTQKYSDDQDGAFVNGVLASVLRKMKAAE